MGQLGDGTSTEAPQVTPVAVSGLTDVTAITAGASHTCALLSGGTVDCWGYNMFGQLGDGTSNQTIQATPVEVKGLSGVTAIAAGQTHTCALLSGGTVECWGDNGSGELGNGAPPGSEICPADDAPCSTTPVAVSGLSGAIAIVAGGDSTCALLSGGTVECWGYDGDGELGGGTSAGPQTCFAGLPCSTVPVAVSGLSGVTAIATGAAHTCALLSGGTVKCWGLNEDGQLGVGTVPGPSTCVDTSACSVTPVAVSGLSGVTAIAAGGETTCAVLSSGTVECWGDNLAGELGDGTSTGPQACIRGVTACSWTPVAVCGL